MSMFYYNDTLICTTWSIIMSFRNIFSRLVSTGVKESNMKTILKKSVAEWAPTLEQLPKHPLVIERDLSKTLLSNEVPDSARTPKTLIQGLTEEEEAAIPRFIN